MNESWRCPPLEATSSPRGRLPSRDVSYVVRRHRRDRPGENARQEHVHAIARRTVDSLLAVTTSAPGSRRWSRHIPSLHRTPRPAIARRADGDRANEPPGQREPARAGEALDVDHPRPVDPRDPQEGHSNPGTGRDRDRRPRSTDDSPREKRVACKVAEVAIRRMMCVEDLASGEKLSGVRGVERHPLPLEVREAG